MSSNRVIGAGGKLPWHIPEDLAFFKRITMGKPLIVGYTTYASIGRPLPGRQMIVLSRQQRDLPGCTCVRTPEEALEACGNAPEIMIGGGRQIYDAFLPMCARQYLTQIFREFEGDAFYPDFPEDDWLVVDRLVHHGEIGRFDFVRLDRRKASAI